MSLPRQLVGFVVSGGLATLADAVTYTLLLALGLQHDLAKGASFLVGTLVSFELNRRFTFGRAREARQAASFFLLYGLTFLLNVGSNHALLVLLGPTLADGAAPTAFLLATAASMVANFLGQRLWVFRDGR